MVQKVTGLCSVLTLLARNVLDDVRAEGVQHGHEVRDENVRGLGTVRGHFFDDAVELAEHQSRPDLVVLVRGGRAEVFNERAVAVRSGEVGANCDLEDEFTTRRRI